MTHLVDPHAFLWFILGDAQLSANAKAVIGNPANRVAVSPASYWEIAIKLSAGKLTLNVQDPYAVWIARKLTDNGFLILPIEVSHAGILVSLPFHHRDPFDRMLIAQAMVEKLPIVSNDKAFDAYPVTRIC